MNNLIAFFVIFQYFKCMYPLRYLDLMLFIYNYLMQILEDIEKEEQEYENNKKKKEVSTKK